MSACVILLAHPFDERAYMASESNGSHLEDQYDQHSSQSIDSEQHPGDGGASASALGGITVLDLTEGMAGALATMFLSDNGARVIRVESRGSEQEWQMPAYAVWHRGKESVFLDLFKALRDAQTGRRRVGDTSAIRSELAHFHKLVISSDVLVESLAPSSAFQTLVSYDWLSSINPRLVHCSITAYGQEGPLRDQPADGDLVMARHGILANQPSFRPGPVHVIHPLPSVGAGILAAQGIAAALYAREKTGSGRKVDTSLMAGALLFAPKVTGEKLSPRPTQRATVGGGPFYSAFECEDGDWIQLGCVHNRFVKLAVSVMHIEGVLADPKFGDGRNVPTEEARQELFGIVADVIKTKPYREWATLFEEADVPYARAGTTEDAMDDPQVRLNEMLIQQDDPALGAGSYMGLPIKLNGTPGKVRGPRPVAGQHTDNVLLEFSAAKPQTSLMPEARADALSQPLEDIEVLEIANVIAGPTAGKLLSELGAKVIKLESPDGDISRPAAPPYFYLLNSNKKSVSINARTQEGREVVKRLATQADVLVANMRPGATDRMGIGTQALGGLNPGIIEAHVTAFGWTGPYAHRPGLDPLAQALIGLQRAQGGPENAPVFLGRLAPTDYTAGAMAALGAIMALFVRKRTGAGQTVHTNLLNAGIVISSGRFMMFQGSPQGPFADKGQYGLGALHRLYETADGWIYLAAESEQYWVGLCSALDRGDLASDPRFASPNARAENDAALTLELAKTLGGRTSADWLKILEKTKIPHAPVVEDYDKGFFSDPQAIANDMIVELQHPNIGSYKISGNLIRFGNTSNVDTRPTPTLGQHNREVLEELGYSESEIDELYRKGVVKTD